MFHETPAMLNIYGSEWDPVILPVFKTGACQARPGRGVFDSHTLPPSSLTPNLATPAISPAKIFSCRNNQDSLEGIENE